jgi:dihydrofolate synthase/folylpolyglutamate synthase
MSYTGAVKYLYDLQKHSIKLGLDRIEKVLSVLGRPHDRFPSVHIAGTNGKGSVASMTASMLMSCGFRVGLFTSPHLVSFTERIRINDIQISQEEVVRLTDEIKERITDIATDDGEATFFEFVTAMAFLYFAREKVDWAVVEVGMGGRLDATNTVMPAVSVITSISYDHKEFLGNSLSDIGSEKAGIIKDRVPVVCSTQETGVELILRKKADAGSSPFFIYGKDFEGVLRSTDPAGTRFDYCSKEHTFRDLYVPLAGEHQVVNACVGIRAFLITSQQRKPSASELEKAVRSGLAAANWKGRIELIRGNPPIMLDGAHNPHAASALAHFARTNFSDHRVILIVGIMSDKDIAGVLSPLLPLASDVIFTGLNYGRSAPPGLLAEQASSLGFQSTVVPSMSEAIATAKQMALSTHSSGKIVPSLILITGSFFTVGEAKELLGEKAILGDLREGFKTREK